MLNACPEEPQLSHILRTGEPPRQTYPERDDVEVVEVDMEEIIELRNERKMKMDATAKINALCEKVLKLTDEEIGECIEMAKEQSRYCHPLKMAKQSRINDLGDYNNRVLTALNNLRDTLKSGANI